MPLPEGLVRRHDDRVVAGVCAGIARWLGVDPVVIRLATVLLGLATAVGIVLYGVAWAVLPAQPSAGYPVDDAADDDRTGLKNALAVGLITVGLLLVLRSMLPIYPDEVVWPASLAALGLGVVWARANEAERARWRGILAGRAAGMPLGRLIGRGVWLRLHLGGVLLICGFAWFIRANSALSDLGTIGAAVLATILGVAVIFGPWVRTLFNQLGAERRERIRSEERADMAAHLHDSVLQTLALIQRRADSPQQSRSLARRQERELRAWLFDDRTPDASAAPATLAAALDQVSDDVEADHDITVDVVTVGDLPLDPRVEALVAATREAVVNAAKHSGEPEVSVYVEVTADLVSTYVRDRGKGFELAEVPSDRRGIADSIISRMARQGGAASVRSARGAGTEVVLRLPLPGVEEE